MSVVGGEIPVTDKDTTECAPHIEGSICSSPPLVQEMRKFLTFLKKTGGVSNEPPQKVVDILMKMLKVDTESGIVAHPKFKQFVGERNARHELKTRFKAEGPWGSTALLDNFNIDDTLAIWAKNSKKAFGKKFYHIPFQMIDFARVGSELARISIPKLIQDNYDCFGVVLNTDVSSGGGKHWFCIYGDLEHSGSEDDPYAIEFFNSSGNPPVREVNIWLENTVRDIMKELHKYCKIIRSATRKLQYSKTECGVWSLMYIKSRLEGKSPDWFSETSADDRDMINFRKYLFRKYN